MNGKELIKQVEDKIKNDKLNKGINLMGCSEAFYDDMYLIYSAFEEADKLKELEEITEKELDHICLVSDFATEVFY